MVEAVVVSVYVLFIEAGHFLWISFLAIDVTSHLERERAFRRCLSFVRNDFVFFN